MTAKVVDVGKAYSPYTAFDVQAGNWVHTSTIATIVVSAVPCAIIGFYVNNTSSGALTLYDSPTTNANPASGLITPAIGMQWFPAVFLTGLTIVTAGTGLDLTFFVVT